MDDELYEQWVGTLIIDGDEAYLPGELIVNEQRRKYRPKARNEAERRERIRESSRLHMRRFRARKRAERAARSS